MTERGRGCLVGAAFGGRVEVVHCLLHSGDFCGEGFAGGVALAIGVLVLCATGFASVFFL